MRMIVAALVGGAVLGFVVAQFLMAEIQKLFADPSTQSFATTGLAAFLGVLWGWVGKGVMGEKPKD